MSANYREILRMNADGSYSIREIKAHAHCSYTRENGVARKELIVCKIAGCLSAIYIS